MPLRIPGIHHVTAIAGDPQKTVDFYAGVLGMRLVKLTVNYDDPATYHLYFGDRSGRPGTVLTFFPWPGAPRGREGTGMVSGVSFSIPPGAIGYWTERLRGRGVPFETGTAPFGEVVIGLRDPDGVRLDLVSHPGGELPPAGGGGGVPSAAAVRGLFSVTLRENRREPTETMLLRTLGFRLIEEREGLARYASEPGGAGTLVEIAAAPGSAPGRVAVGTIHHVAWRARSDEEVSAWRREIELAGANVTPVIDRKYFRSIYFREPGGALFEIATDGPGFAVDEPEDRLGERLVLPPWLETSRARIEANLPGVRVPQAA